jgi:uncharacterized protein (DUF58 family)
VSTQDRRLPTVLLLGISLIAAGVLTRHVQVLTLAIPVLAYAACLVVARRGLPVPQLDLVRSPSSLRVREGTDVEVELLITNSGSRLPLIAARDDLPDEEMLSSGRPGYLGPLAPDETARIHYGLRPQRGLHMQDSVRIVSWARGGLAFQEHDLQCSTLLSAVPEAQRLPNLAITPRRTHAFAGSVLAEVPGPGIDYFGCRAYAPGDDIRRINWRAVARTDRLIINEYEQERMADVVIILDIRSQAHIQVGDRGTFEPTCRAAASFADHFLRQGNRVGLLLYGLTVDWVEPAAGRFHLERILASIAAARPGKSFAFEDLALLPMTVFPSGSQLVLISRLVREDDHLIPIRLAARGYSVIVLYPEASQLEAANQPKDDALRLAMRFRELQVRTMFRSMLSHGVRVIPWDLDVSLATALDAARFQRPPRGRSRCAI